MAAMTEVELRALPASIDLPTTFRAVGIGRTKGYELVKAGSFPVPVLRLGRVQRVRTADVLELLGIPRSVEQDRAVLSA